MTTTSLSTWVLDEVRAWSDEAHDALCHAPYAGLRQVQCRKLNDRLVLFGIVPNFYLKQVAQTVVLKRFGSAIPVENQLEVECTISTDLEIIGEERLDRQG